MAKERLSRQELVWLLAQEARGAASALREGVTQLKQPIPNIDRLEHEITPMETSLDALDDAIGMLSALESKRPGAARGGRIDLAALLYELAPNARIAIEPGAGTEVSGDESDLSRMLQVLMSQAGDPGAPSGSSSPEVRIRRQDDLVRITVELGPDRSATADLERRWLSRMAMQLGGRLDLEGGTQSLLLPADSSSAQREVVALREELEQAQRLGEAYARELAEVFTASSPPSEPAPPASVSAPVQRFELLVNTAAGLAHTLRTVLSGLREDAALLDEGPGELANVAQRLTRRAASGWELLEQLQRLAQCPVNELPTEVDLTGLVEQLAGRAQAHAARQNVSIVTTVAPAVSARTRATTLTLVLHAMLDHAIFATPRGGQVAVRLDCDRDDARIVVEDGGPGIPESAAADLLIHRVDPTSLGRPAGIALVVADTAAARLGHPLTIGHDPEGRFQLQLTLAAGPNGRRESPKSGSSP